MLHLAAAMWRVERIGRRLEDLEVQQARNSIEGSGRMDSQEAYYATSRLQVLSLEACAFRDVLRITGQLLEAKNSERERPSTGLPQNILKTKNKEIWSS